MPANRSMTRTILLSQIATSESAFAKWFALVEQSEVNPEKVLNEFATILDNGSLVISWRGRNNAVYAVLISSGEWRDETLKRVPDRAATSYPASRDSAWQPAR